MALRRSRLRVRSSRSSARGHFAQALDPRLGGRNSLLPFQVIICKAHPGMNYQLSRIALTFEEANQTMRNAETANHVL